ncbi:5-formyltetrahydrofolate cyclo-ligase [Alicyclobacillus sp. SP_1]|uniref:5-formyltetrahydrofolate cyclo-ligase n=1 Tax=Alicyclobacillus sp. SP_1 TaxID=2942475 RepID=UPI0021582A63|nr:5-formyltetrahydrofolate cyclo-ligase [Alicyclobacillus sp. SP_1]
MPENERVVGPAEAALLAEKGALRRELLARRSSQSEEERSRLDARIRAHALNWVTATFAKRPLTIALYRSIRGEVNLHPLGEQLRVLAHHTVYPRTEADGPFMNFYRVTADDGFETGRFHIPEPLASADSLVSVADLDVVFVPGLAFAKDGNRLGYGAGFYDRALNYPLFHGHAVGVLYQFQCRPSIPAGAHDRPMDFLLSEGGVHRCERSV